MGIMEEMEIISKLTEDQIGPTQENIKQNIIVPMLVSLGHKKESLEAGYRIIHGDETGIFIGNVPCKVIFVIKNYNESMTDRENKIKDYARGEGVLLAVVTNGREISIYNPLRGVALEKSLLHSIKMEDIGKESEWRKLSEFLLYDSLSNRNVAKKIGERELEIENAMLNEERLECAYRNKINLADMEIEAKQYDINRLKDGIETLKRDKEYLRKELRIEIEEIWNIVDLPMNIFSGINQLPEVQNENIGDEESRNGERRREESKCKYYGGEYHIGGKPQKTVELFTNIDEFCIGLASGIKPVFHKTSIGYKYGRSTFCSVNIQKYGLLVFLKLNYSLLKCPPSYARNVSRVGHWGVGDVEFHINSLEELDVCKSFIRQSFEENKR